MDVICQTADKCATMLAAFQWGGGLGELQRSECSSPGGVCLVPFQKLMDVNRPRHVIGPLCSGEAAWENCNGASAVLREAGGGVVHSS